MVGVACSAYLQRRTTAGLTDRVRELADDAAEAGQQAP